MGQNLLVRSIKAFARRILGIARWASVASPKIRNGSPAERRILLIYDFASQPFSLGDILIFQEAGLVLAKDHGLSRIDFAAVYDRKKPVVEDPAFAHIDAENFLFHLSSVLPAAQTNPLLGSLLLFDSHRTLESYIWDNSDRYLIWPRLTDYASGEYLYYRIFRELFLPHFRRHGSLPSLHSRSATANWARCFLKNLAGESLAVTVQLRRNPANPARDSVYDAWLQFFQDTQGRYPVKFFVLCGASEVDPRLRGFIHVILAKDFHTSTEQDLALVDAAAAHMGAASGPGTMALFSTKPFCMFGVDPKVTVAGGLVQHGPHLRFPFSSTKQIWFMEKETPETLRLEFERLWEHLSTAGERTV